MGYKLVDSKDKVLRELQVALAQRLNNAARFAVDNMLDLVPVDTGQLRSTIRQTVAAVPDRLEAVVRVGSPEVYWGPLVNYGTSKMAAQPFFTVSMLLTKNEFPAFLYGRAR